jgi:catechol 2,3-dioxygenase-like lactoylglutathione lyase family enzyme
MDALRIDHVNLAFPADRLDEVIGFYVDALGFETDFDDPYAAVADDPGLFAIRLGDDYGIYVNPTDEFDPEATNFRHVAVCIAESPDCVRETVESEDLPLEHTAERTHSQFGAYTSYYVGDPFGYTVELMAVGAEHAD